MILTFSLIYLEDTFEMQLVGGSTSNAGRVEVSYDDIWSDVCYEPEKDKGIEQWSFYNVQVVCRELGFPGAMFVRRGGYGNGVRESGISDYKCTDSKFILTFL